MRVSSWWYILVFATLLLQARGARAQWKNVAPNLVAGTSFGGAMQYRDGIIWAGGDNLWRSTDLGATWQKSGDFVNAMINDIAFFDKRNGLIGTGAQGIFHTTDGGTTWLQILGSTSISKVSFNGSASVLQALDFSGILYTSTDGGTTWTPSNASNGECRSFATASDGTVYVQSANIYSNPYTGIIVQSHDLGKTWATASGSMDGDCHTLAVDSCDPERLYLVNEEIYTPTDSTAQLYLSVNGGNSWQTVDSHHSLFFSGALTTTNDAIFAGTMGAQKGTYRSIDRGVTWKSIGGPATPADSRNIAAIDKNTVLAMDTSGSIWLTTNGGGDSVAGSIEGALAFSPKTVFTGDTIGCDSVMQTVQIVRNCPAPYINSLSLVGPDSANFRIDSVSTSSISIALLTQKLGAQNASLIAALDNGTTDTVRLGGYVAPYVGAITLSTHSLFAGDTLHCDSLTSSFYYSITGCRPPPVTFYITGKDSDSFHLAGNNVEDSLSVEWTSQKPGAQQAWLVAALDNGARDSVALSGFSTTTPLVYSIQPQSLYATDSLYVSCDPALPDTIWITAASCLWPRVKSERIIGVDSLDYSISHSMGDELNPEDSIGILFTPLDTGLRSAAYQLTLDNDTVITIPLEGVGLGVRQLSLAASSVDAKTDTIGGNVSIPITLDGLAHPETIELVLHYPLADLLYDGSFDQNGTEVDMPGEQWPGRSKLRIVGAMPGTTSAYARFNVFSDTNYNPQITFDSLSIPTERTPCEYAAPPTATATIFPLEACSDQMLSRLVHLGEKPLLDIRPNPTNGELTITPSITIGAATIEVFDMLGTLRERFNAVLSSGTPDGVSLSLGNGVYYLRVLSPAGEENVPIVIAK